MSTIVHHTSPSSPAYQVQHHPSEALLMDYTMGTLSDGFAMAIEIHLESCALCRQDLKLMREMGGEMLRAEPAPSAPTSALKDILAHLPAQEPASVEIAAPAEPIAVGSRHLPARLSALHADEKGQLPFKTRAPGIATIPLMKEEDGTYARLMRIAAGKSVPHHSHNGVELTVIISGAYHDEISHYGPGDFIEHGPEIQHQPIADTEEDCVCLGVTEGPLAFTKPTYRLLRPFFPV